MKSKLHYGNQVLQKLKLRRDARHNAYKINDFIQDQDINPREFIDNQIVQYAGHPISNVTSPNAK